MKWPLSADGSIAGACGTVNVVARVVLQAADRELIVTIGGGHEPMVDQLVAGVVTEDRAVNAILCDRKGAPFDSAE